MTKNILITGGAGFVGSNLALFLQQHWPDHQIICLDNFIRQGSRLNKRRLEDHHIRVIEGDIRDKQTILSFEDVRWLVDCASEPAVLAAFENPVYTIETNLIGTMNCLELARKCKSNIIFLSTNRVYPIGPLNAVPFEEKGTRFDWKEDCRDIGISYNGLTVRFPLDGVRSLYGTTKLASEHIIQEYCEMFGLKGVMTRFGIIAGPWQMGKIDQGLVGYWVACHKYQKDLRYIGFGGEGKQVRDALHVDDLCDLIGRQMNSIDAVNGEIFNAGGGRPNSFSLQELTSLVQDITKTKVPIHQAHENRKADIRVVIMDNADITQKLGWRPTRGLEQVVLDVNRWIDDHKESLRGALV
jgi:CDP-paratose 2-epimerase